MERRDRRCGTLDDHCCHLDGRVCRFLEENVVPGRRWACGLLRKLGTWEKVHASPEYQADVRPTMARLPGGADCGDWPPPGVTCGVCDG